MATIKQIQALKETLAAALGAYHAIASTTSPDDSREASNAVKAARKAISDAICEGAEPCPTCGTAPIGIEQPRGRGGVEFEIGCPVCRDMKVRGGMLPKHAVEAWNEVIEAKS